MQDAGGGRRIEVVIAFFGTNNFEWYKCAIFLRAGYAIANAIANAISNAIAYPALK